jgi:DNA-binding transcriptional ArsR family regulator
MSASRRSRAATGRDYAPVFAALGDETRLSLIAQLCEGRRRSITQLAEGASVTRQAISKHLSVLEKAGFVRRARRGRESLYAFEPRAVEDARAYLDRVGRQWEDALERLKTFVET